MTQKDIKDFAKTLLRESDSKIQLMYGTNIKLFDKPEYKTLLVNCLKNQSITRDQLKITPSRLKQFDRGLSAGIAQAHYKHSTKGKISYEQFMLQFLDQLFSLKPDTLLTNTKFTSYRKYFFNIIPGNIDKEKWRRINTFLKTISQKELYALGQQMTKLNSNMKKLYVTNKPITTAVIDNHKDIYDLCCSCQLCCKP